MSRYIFTPRLPRPLSHQLAQRFRRFRLRARRGGQDPPRHVVEVRHDGLQRQGAAVVVPCDALRRVPRGFRHGRGQRSADADAHGDRRGAGHAVPRAGGVCLHARVGGRVGVPGAVEHFGPGDAADAEGAGGVEAFVEGPQVPGVGAEVHAPRGEDVFVRRFGGASRGVVGDAQHAFFRDGARDRFEDSGVDRRDGQRDDGAFSEGVALLREGFGDGGPEGVPQAAAVFFQVRQEVRGHAQPRREGRDVAFREVQREQEPPLSLQQVSLFLAVEGDFGRVFVAQKGYIPLEGAALRVFQVAHEALFRGRVAGGERKHEVVEPSQTDRAEVLGHSGLLPVGPSRGARATVHPRMAETFSKLYTQNGAYKLTLLRSLDFCLFVPTFAVVTMISEQSDMIGGV